MSTKSKTLPAIRSIPYGIIRELRQKGLDPSTAEAGLGAKQVADLVDVVLEKVYNGVDFSEFDYDVLVDFAMKTYRRAYGGPEAIKNS